MNEDFHYYATYCASYLAGFSHEESLTVAYFSQFVDVCSATLLGKLKAPQEAVTTQLQAELIDARTDPVGLQEITRIWASFHFLPRDLYAPSRGTKLYRNKYRLICGPNGSLLVDTVEAAKGRGLQAAGLAMHVLSDTWAHQYFAGTPSLVINNTNQHFFEILMTDMGARERRISFRHNPGADDDLEEGKFTNTIFQSSEFSIMNLGHGRAGHLPDYCFMRYRYLPAWGQYREIVKDNPSDYLHAFLQMIHALKYLRGAVPSFEKNTYDFESALPCMEEIRAILLRRQLDAGADWKALGERLSGREIERFDIEKHQREYLEAERGGREETSLGQFFLAAMRQKGMVANRVLESGSTLAGASTGSRPFIFRRKVSEERHSLRR